MINKMEIANMVFEGVSRAISISPKYCSKIKHKSSPCTICYSLCPTQAITVGGPGETITIDWDNCTGCGMCVSQCPAQVFTLRHGGYKKFTDNLTTYINPKGNITIACSMNPLYNKRAASVECVGIFNIVDILLLYLRGASRITIKYGVCSQCESKHGVNVLKEELKHLEQLKLIFEDLNNIEIIEEYDSIKIIFPIQHPVLEIKEEEKPNPTVDRRGMFSFFTSSLKESLIKSADMVTVESNPEKTVIDFSHEVTKRRKLFLDIIMELGKITQQEVTTGQIFNNIAIEESCIYCGMCARFCNTGALKINDERTEITFNPSQCISCGLCEKSCYHNKLEYRPTLNLRTFFKDNILVSRNNGYLTISDMTRINV